MAAKPGRGSKNKGANAEREVAKLLQEVIDPIYEEFGLEAPEIKRNLEQTRGGGYDLVGLDWLALEVKRVEQLQINKWWEQTLRQARVMQEPVLIYRQNNKPWKVIMKTMIAVSPGRILTIRSEISVEDFKTVVRERTRSILKSS